MSSSIFSKRKLSPKEYGIAKDVLAILRDGDVTREDLLHHYSRVHLDRALAYLRRTTTIYVINEGHTIRYSLDVNLIYLCSYKDCTKTATSRDKDGNRFCDDHSTELFWKQEL